MHGAASTLAGTGTLGLRHAFEHAIEAMSTQPLPGTSRGRNAESFPCSATAPILWQRNVEKSPAWNDNCLSRPRCTGFAPRSRIGDSRSVKKSAAWHGLSPDQPDGAGFAPRSRIGNSRSVKKSAAWRGMSTNRLPGAKVAPGSRIPGRNVADPAAWHGICATQPDCCHGAPRSRISDTKHVAESAVWRKSGARRLRPIPLAPGK